MPAIFTSPSAGRWISPAAVSGPRQLGRAGEQRLPLSSHVSLRCGFLSISCGVVSRGGIRAGGERGQALLCCQSLSHPEAVSSSLLPFSVYGICCSLQPCP